MSDYMKEVVRQPVYQDKDQQARVDGARIAAGKTLRDEFAMAGLAIFSENLRMAADRSGAIKNAAVSAYALADAMMKARQS